LGSARCFKNAKAAEPWVLVRLTKRDAPAGWSYLFMKCSAPVASPRLAVLSYALASSSELQFIYTDSPIQICMSRIFDSSTAVLFPAAQQEDCVNFLDPAPTAMALIASNCE
jgi:hypothetical protein